MKVFERTDEYGWGNRLNFVDKNNVVLGYDYASQCCESFFYYVTETEPMKFDNEPEEEDKSGLLNEDSLYFDTSYNKDLEGETSWNEDYATVFKVLGGETDLFIVLVNCHNGYYGHGFDMKNSEGKIIFNGSL